MQWESPTTRFFCGFRHCFPPPRIWEPGQDGGPDSSPVPHDVVVQEARLDNTWYLYAATAEEITGSGKCALQLERAHALSWGAHHGDGCIHKQPDKAHDRAGGVT